MLVMFHARFVQKQPSKRFGSKNEALFVERASLLINADCAFRSEANGLFCKTERAAGKMHASQSRIGTKPLILQEQWMWNGGWMANACIFYELQTA